MLGNVCKSCDSVSSDIGRCGHTRIDSFVKEFTIREQAKIGLKSIKVLGVLWGLEKNRECSGMLDGEGVQLQRVLPS
jgi:hypothetical protein